ncbi:hypothetical protein C8Q80DRAFT_179390 [Daedaleopsis nitida]|nr:hypothetical protein C8Q80DRAFT_179390 [Daedaleopsis nitida]
MVVGCPRKLYPTEPGQVLLDRGCGPSSSCLDHLPEMWDGSSSGPLPLAIHSIDELVVFFPRPLRPRTYSASRAETRCAPAHVSRAKVHATAPESCATSSPIPAQTCHACMPENDGTGGAHLSNSKWGTAKPLGGYAHVTSSTSSHPCCSPLLDRHGPDVETGPSWSAIRPRRSVGTLLLLGAGCLAILLYSGLLDISTYGYRSRSSSVAGEYHDAGHGSGSELI